jgi:hypothetical protein
VPAGSAAVDGDCDDTTDLRSPGKAEECDDLDNDCNGDVDDGLDERQFFEDADLDGFGDPDTTVYACGPLPGKVEDDTDCDDDDPANAPGLTEICDGGDNDCDTLVDDLDDSVDPGSLTDWYRDPDGDGFGDGAPTQRCEAGGAYTAQVGGDCDEANPQVTPSATEVCGGADEDCDGDIDDDDASVDPAGFSSFWPDGDTDGLGDMSAAAVQACVRPNGHVGNDDDCDDSRSQVGAAVDWWSDGDADGYGDGMSLGLACPPPAANTVPASGPVDCNDGNGGVHPGAVEICGDNLDNDCAGGDAQCPPVGTYVVRDGDPWDTDPPVYSCVEACALVYGGVAADWHCSTSGAVLTYTGYVCGYADFTYCTTPVAETFSFEQAGNPGYNCGSVGCAYSAYVRDGCGPAVVNWCWPD